MVVLNLKEQGQSDFCSKILERIKWEENNSEQLKQIRQCCKVYNWAHAKPYALKKSNKAEEKAQGFEELNRGWLLTNLAQEKQQKSMPTQYTLYRLLGGTRLLPLSA